MKKLSLFLLCALALYSCDKAQQETENPYETQWRPGLTVKENNLYFQPDGGEATITLNETVTKATCPAAWISTSVKDKVVTLTAEKYTGSQTRYTTLKLEGEAGSLTVPVSQYGVVIDGLEIADIAAPVEGLSLSQNVNLNTELTLETSADWIHATFEEGVITITVDENTAPGTREGTISYGAGAIHKTAAVIQDPPLGLEKAWKIEGGESYYTEASDSFFLPLTVTAGSADKYTLFILPADKVETTRLKDWIFETLVSERKTVESIEGGLVSAKQGNLSEDTLLPGFGDTFVIAVGYGGDHDYITGQYQYLRLTVKDTRPGFFETGGEDMDWGTF